MFCLHDACQFLNFPVYNVNQKIKNRAFSIDTRTLERDDIFVALKGANQDGHDLLKKAYQNGASGALISLRYFKSHREWLLEDAFRFPNLIVVDSTKDAMLKLSGVYRERFNIPVIGITGSVGKTTTKEFLWQQLSESMDGVKNFGSFNNDLGVPLTLLRLDANDEYCICEVGANHVGEIERLTSYLKPTAGVLTGISAAHLEGFGSLQRIYDAKLELAQSLKEGSPFVIPDNDSELDMRLKETSLNVIRVGETDRADYRISQISQQDGTVHFLINETYPCCFSGYASFLANNAAMSFALAHASGWLKKQELYRWDTEGLPSGRFEEQKLPGGITAIYDGYNANPCSFEMAIKAFSGYPTQKRRVLVIADMAELGDDATYWHNQLAEVIGNSNMDLVLGYGDYCSSVTIPSLKKLRSKIMTVILCEDANAVAHYLGDYLQAGDVCLLKGSRCMQVENVLVELEGFLNKKPTIVT